MYASLRGCGVIFSYCKLPRYFSNSFNFFLFFLLVRFDDVSV